MEDLYTEQGFDANQISIVLVNTSHPGNIGAAARGMKNMGLKKLVLVNPEEFPSGSAVARSASAVDVVENAVVVDSLKSAISGCGLVIGASARSRKIPWPMLDPSGCAEKVLKEHHANKVALVFGREDSGLNNEELQLCHYHVQIPSNPECSSLNLATAVMVISYEIAKLRTVMNQIAVPEEDDFWDQPKSTIDDLERFYEHLERVLIAVRFHDPENPRQLMQRIRRLFGRIRIDEMEMSVLRGILSNVEWHIDKKNK